MELSNFLRILFYSLQKKNYEFCKHLRNFEDVSMEENHLAET